MVKRSSDDHDLEHTDELPILLETVVLPEDTGGGIDDTAGHTALYHRLGENETNDAALRADRAAVAEEIEALEAQLRGVADLNRELERRLAERDRSIADLERTLTTLRDTADAAADAERLLATQLALRDARLAELSATIERLREAAAASTAEIDRLRDAAETARLATEAAESTAAAQAVRQQPPASPAVSGGDGEAAMLREEIAALSAYIEGRRRWWDELQAAHRELATKVAALAHELAAGEKQRAAAADLAARESSRATALRAELVASARRVEELERELKEATRANLTAAGPVPGTPASATGALASAAPSPSEEEVTASAVVADPTPSIPLASPVAIAPASPGSEAASDSEAIAQLEAQVAYKREQVAAQLVELHEREQRLRASSDDLERLRQERQTLRSELEEQRAAIARLEQTVIDKDRALAARDSRIGSLQEELERRAAAAEASNAGAAAAPRPDSLELAAGRGVPALLCLTGDATARFLLTKETITIGRGAQCDLQILTHFVSREHARISTTRDGAIIEDLGSRNGVYVNSVRVDRQALRQGDLILIGETEFRFVESMAH